MREIEFRGQRQDNNEWVYGDLIRTPEDSLADYYIQIDVFAAYDERIGFWNDGYSMSLLNASVPIISETVGQYTGLNDKNGTKIFEGDIIQDAETQELFEIIYEGYSFLRLNKSRFFLGFDLSCDDYEVIGNIHNNPELLKGGVE